MDSRVAICVLVTAVSVGAASAHHGWGSYDAAKSFTITAPVETLAWADPTWHFFTFTIPSRFRRPPAPR